MRVGSGYARKPLPYGTDAEKREAIKRAIKHHEFWGERWAVLMPPGCKHPPKPKGSPIAACPWLPLEVCYPSLPALRELLRLLALSSHPLM